MVGLRAPARMRPIAVAVATTGSPSRQMSRMLAASHRSPGTMVTPRRRSGSGSVPGLTRQRTGSPAARRRRTTRPPRSPVPPTTKTMTHHLRFGRSLAPYPCRFAGPNRIQPMRIHLTCSSRWRIGAVLVRPRIVPGLVLWSHVGGGTPGVDVACGSDGDPLGRSSGCADVPADRDRLPCPCFGGHADPRVWYCSGSSR